MRGTLRGDNVRLRVDTVTCHGDRHVDRNSDAESTAKPLICSDRAVTYKCQPRQTLAATDQKRRRQASLPISVTQCTVPQTTCAMRISGDCTETVQERTSSPIDRRVPMAMVEQPFGSSCVTSKPPLPRSITRSKSSTFLTIAISERLPTGDDNEDAEDVSRLQAECVTDLPDDVWNDGVESSKCDDEDQIECVSRRVDKSTTHAEDDNDVIADSVELGNLDRAGSLRLITDDTGVQHCLDRRSVITKSAINPHHSTLFYCSDPELMLSGETELVGIVDEDESIGDVDDRDCSSTPAHHHGGQVRVGLPTTKNRPLSKHNTALTMSMMADGVVSTVTSCPTTLTLGSDDVIDGEIRGHCSSSIDTLTMVAMEALAKIRHNNIDEAKSVLAELFGDRLTVYFDEQLRRHHHNELTSCNLDTAAQSYFDETLEHEQNSIRPADVDQQRHQDAAARVNVRSSADFLSFEEPTNVDAKCAEVSRKQLPTKTSSDNLPRVTAEFQTPLSTHPISASLSIRGSSSDNGSDSKKISETSDSLVALSKSSIGTWDSQYDFVRKMSLVDVLAAALDEDKSTTTLSRLDRELASTTSRLRSDVARLERRVIRLEKELTKERLRRERLEVWSEHVEREMKSHLHAKIIQCDMRYYMYRIIYMTNIIITTIIMAYYNKPTTSKTVHS